MNKIIFTFLVLMCSVLSVFAQFNFGINAGMNFGGPLGKTEGKGRPIPGFIGGPVFNYQIQTRWKVSAMLLYSFRGAIYEQISKEDTTLFVTIGQQKIPVNTNYTSTVKGELRLHYFDLPLLVSYYYKKKYSFDFGPQLSYLFSGSDKGTNDVVFVYNGIFNQKILFDNFSRLNCFDIGFSLGTTYYTNFGLNISLRASRGFISIYEKDFFISNGQPEIGLYNTFMHLGLGYSIYRIKD